MLPACRLLSEPQWTVLAQASAARCPPAFSTGAQFLGMAFYLVPPSVWVVGTWFAHSFANLRGADLEAVFHRERGQRNVVVGHSYGTSMALFLAARINGDDRDGGGGGEREAARVDALVLLAPGFSPSCYPAESLQVRPPGSLNA